MRSSRANNNWELTLEPDPTYSSSDEEDERTRLQKPSGKSLFGGGRRSSEVNSPIESDNTYAEANLLQTDKGGDLSDSDAYGGSNGSSHHRYQVPHQNILRSPHREPHRFLGGRSNSTQDTQSPFYGTASRSVAPSRTSTNLPVRRAANGPLPEPPGSTSSRRGQLAMTPDRNWASGDTLGLAETRLGNREGGEYGMKYGTSLHLTHQIQAKAGRGSGGQQQSLVSSSGGSSSSTTKASSLHRRSLSDDSLSIDKQINQNSSGGSTSTAVITSASNPIAEDAHIHPHTMDPIVMPGFPVRTLQGHPPPPYSPSREKFRIGKRCQFHCSWKLVAFALTLLTLVLSSVIAYFGAVKFPSRGPLHDVIISEDCITSDPPLSVLSVEKHQMQQADSGILNSASRSRPVTITITPGRPYEATINPMTFWRSRLPVHRPGPFRLNLTFSPESATSSKDLAIYGKARFPPSVTNYDWIHIVSNGELRLPDLYSLRSKRSGTSGIAISESFPLGDMFIAILNDGLSPVSFRIALTEDASGVSSLIRGSESAIRKPAEETSVSKCLKDCSGQGTCVNGKCVCNPRFSGPGCTLSVCPLLCSGNGVYQGGSCSCHQGWKGEECDVLASECQDPDCSGHGICSLEGKCICEPGWTGESCETMDCKIPNCYGHGICQNAVCHCHPGWMGDHCELKNEALLQCLPNCSGHGIYDFASGSCDCHESWSGADCNMTLCSLDCGQAGLCLQGACLCQKGWTGPRCAFRNCDARCSSHGQCKNGKCLCMRGWNGKHCMLNGCGPEGKCNSRGTCEANQNSEYECKCHPGWTGRYCEYHEETDCEDGIDNDENGLTDCADSRCCSHPSCRKNIMCVYSADPVSVLSLRDPHPLESGASFFERVTFLFQGGAKTVQSYAKSESFDPLRASIIRGRVITSQGQGIIGVRVSVDRLRDASNYGFTLTRPHGWFDMVVNGGGAVTLQFQRSPLKAMTRTTYIPWNRIVVINPVVMTSYGGLGISRDEEDTSLQVSYFDPCKAHDHEGVKPRVFTSYFPLLTSADSGHLSPELQAFKESIPIPETNMRLVYSSSSSPGYKSLIQVRLTPSEISDSLDNITLKIIVAGSVFRKTFEADPNLSYKFLWNKRNAYKQVVYGVTEAEVSVGYHYRNCMHTIWNTRIVKVRGQEAPITNVGGWNLDSHHHFNRHQGILEKGDGSFYVFNHEKVESVMGGSGTEKRPFVCRPRPLCEQTLANRSHLYEVISMTTGPDGSLYIGDYNVIRKVKPDGSVISLLYLGDKDRKYIYDLKISPADNKLYMTNAESYQVFIIEDLSDHANPVNNSVVIAGTGKRCLPGDRDSCGDGGSALKARFSYPKGLAVSVDRTIYISDGQNIRLISSDGDISTLIGHHRRREGPPKPLDCRNTYVASHIQLQWPTKLELNPLDSSLHIVDDTMILRLTSDLRVVVVAGASSLCPPSGKITLGPISDIAFSSNDGHLYVASGGTVHHINSDELAKRFTTKSCICPQNQSSGECSEFCVRAITSMTMDGQNLYISDSMKILRIKRLVQNGSPNIRLKDSISGEIYTFNSLGQHLSTLDSETGFLKTSFKYKKFNAGHQLFEVRNRNDKILLSLERGYSSQISSLSIGNRKKMTLKMSSREQLLLEFWLSDRNAKVFEYNEQGLLKSSRSNDGDFLYVSNDETGRVKQIISSTGENVRIGDCSEDNDVPLSGDFCFSLYRNGAHLKSIILNQNECKIVREGYSDIRYAIKKDSASIIKENGNQFSIKSSLEEKFPPNEGDLYSSLPPVSMIQKHGKKLVRSLDWSRASGSREKSKQLKMNGRTVLDVRYLEEANGVMEERTSKGNGLLVIKVLYDEQNHPISWSSTSGRNCSRSYDTLSRLVEDRCARRTQECFVYDVATGRLKEKNSCGNRLGIKYFYSTPLKYPTSIELPLGSVYAYDYDDFGGLSGVHLPRSDFRFRFKSQIHFGGKVKYYHYLPGLQEPYVYYKSSSGLLLEIRPPTGNGVSLFKYNDENQILKTISADVQIHYRRKSGTLHRIETFYTGIEGFFCREISLPFGHSDLQKRISFSPESGFASASFRYQESYLTGYIGGKNISQTWRNGIRLLWDKIPNKGGPSRVEGEFIVTHLNLNETLLTDSVAYYSKGDGFLVLEIHGREYFRATYEFDERNQLSSEAVTSYNRRSKETLQNYQYDAEGRLLRNNDLEWQFDGDLGNLIKTSSRSKWKKKKVKHLRYKPGTYMRSDMEYDDSGRVTFNGRVKLQYSIVAELDCLRRAILDGLLIEYYYDHLGRLIGRKSDGVIRQFFYAYPESEHLVSHIYEPQSGSLTQLKYDDHDNLIFANINGEGHYVVNDFSGSPILYFAVNGARGVRVVREIHRSPYGIVLSDTNPEFPIPIDFKGGIKDPDTGLIHLQDFQSGNCRLYDPKSFSYFTPRWRKIFDTPYEPLSLNLYSFYLYNPLSRKESFPQGNLISSLTNSLKKSENILSKDYLLTRGYLLSSGPLFSPTSFETEFEKRMEQLLSLSYFKTVSPWPKTNVRMSRTDSALGRFVVFDPSSSRVYSVSDGSLNQVQRSVFTQVLEGAQLVEFKTVPRDDDMLFFTKPKIRPDDITALRRLGPSVNLTIHESQTSEKEIKFLDVKVHLEDTILNIRYGTSPESEKTRLLRHAYKTVSRKIWLRERTTGHWSPRDMQSLLAQGFVSGYKTQYRLPDIDRYPELSTDLNNVEIVQDSVKILPK